MINKSKILYSFWFIAALALLLLNDFVLKDALDNWFTGKLSDFTGLFVFPLFWTALFPKYKKLFFWWTMGLFIFWKSSLSDDIINNWNMLGILPVSRVVDYTDLLALVVLPLAYIYESKESIRTLKLSPVMITPLAIFAFCATSYDTSADVQKEYHFDFSKDELRHRLFKVMNKNGDYRLDSAYFHLDSIWKIDSNFPPVVWDKIPDDMDPVDVYVRDTTYLWLNDVNYCYSHLNYEVAISGNDNISKMVLFRLDPDCTNDDNPKKQISDLNYAVELFQLHFVEEIESQH